MFSSLRIFGMVSLLAAAHVALAGPLATRQSVDPNNDFSGQATWYDVGLGACGYTDTPDEYIVALNSAQFGSGYPGPYCNRYLVVENTENGATAVARVRDECPGCSYGSLDMSQGLFTDLAAGGLDEGVFPIIWSWLPTDYSP